MRGDLTYFCDLVGVLDPALVPAEIAAELGVSETSDKDPDNAVTAALRETAALIVLDNLEELTAARGFLAGLLEAAPGLQMVATSRVPLGITGEVEFRVPPLELPTSDGLAEIEASPAGMLFLERARAVGRLDELDGPTAEAVAQLCRRLDGLPLALELAAARTRILPPATILRHLEAQTSGLLEKAGDDDRRHGSLDAVLTWSLDLLEDNEAEVLGAVAICPGGFDLAIADALAPDRRVIQALDVLATHGLLVERAEVDGEPWYQLLETIRVAALQRTSARAYAAHWLRLSTYLPQRLEGTFEAYYQLDEVAFRRADATLDDIRAVLDWTTPNDPGLNLSLAARFWPYWYVRGRSREGLARLRSAIAANPDASSDLARGLLGLAVLSRNAGLSEVRKIGAEAARIAENHGRRSDRDRRPHSDCDGG